MKYKVGDKVRIKSVEWYNENKDKDGVVNLILSSNSRYNLVESMTAFCGKVVTIGHVDERRNCYEIKEDVEEYHWAWTDEMIEGLVEEGTKFDIALSGRIYVKLNENYCDLTREKDDVSTTYRKVDELATKIDKELPSGNQYVLELLDGYQFVDENGNVINATTIALEKKKTEYPKTYEECCKILGFNSEITAELIFHYPLKCGDYTTMRLPEMNKFEKFIQLYLCRNAYWKLYGEEMGLGKPWKPDWEESDGGYRYCIVNRSNNIELVCEWLGENYILSFPSAETRDIFYVNFKEEIEKCKELL
jgi:hypothetical protein